MLDQYSIKWHWIDSPDHETFQNQKDAIYSYPEKGVRELSLFLRASNSS